MGWTPLADNAWAEASDRANAVTLCPAPINSSVTADPMNPVAPVTKTRMALLLGCGSIDFCGPMGRLLSTESNLPAETRITYN
jgi:hypothetical protein